LSVVYGIVKNYGGWIEAKSEIGRGSTFDVYLPLIEKGEAGAGAVARQPLPTGDERILFVDDETSLTDVGRQILERLGYRVDCKTSSLEALEAIRAHPDEYDLIITDQTMPDLTGLDFAREVLEVRPDMPIILCTGYSRGVTAEQARKAGIASFLLKPLDIRVLTREIRAALDNHLNKG
jgi:two-component system cell cycle sensor histidine kinase/response regulator CckA